jgi:hypothetical protein
MMPSVGHACTKHRPGHCWRRAPRPRPTPQERLAPCTQLRRPALEEPASCLAEQGAVHDGPTARGACSCQHPLWGTLPCSALRPVWAPAARSAPGGRRCRAALKTLWQLPTCLVRAAWQPPHPTDAARLRVQSSASGWYAAIRCPLPRQPRPGTPACGSHGRDARHISALCCSGAAIRLHARCSSCWALHMSLVVDYCTPLMICSRRSQTRHCTCWPLPHLRLPDV